METKNLLILAAIVLAAVLIFGIYNKTLTGKLSGANEGIVVDRLQGTEIAEKQLFTMYKSQQVIVDNFLKNLDSARVIIDSIDKANGKVSITVVYGDFSENAEILIHNGKTFDLNADGKNDLDVSVEDILSPGIAKIAVQAA